MASKNTVTIEFKAIGDGLDVIRAALRGVRENTRGLESASASIDAVTRSALSSTRGITNLTNAIGLLPSGTSSAVAAFTQLGGSLGAASAAMPLVGIAAAATAVSIGVVATAAGAAKDALLGLIQETVPKAEAFRAALLGLESVAKFKGIDPEAAVASVQSLALVRNGLLSVGDASKALQNLLASGFTLDQSIELIQRIGDKAAFSRQQGLEFGEAIVKTTAGIKQGNSILADGAGVTENLGTMLKRAGVSASELSNIAQNASVRQAVLNGFFEGTADAIGNAAKLAESYTGAMARIDVGVTNVEIKIGRLISGNVALTSVLKLGGDALDLVNNNFDTYITALSVAVPLVQLLTAALIPVAQIITGIAAAAGGALKALAALRQYNNIGDPVQNAAINKTGDDIIDLATKASLTAARLPSEVGKINDALKNIGKDAAPSGVFDFLGSLLPSAENIQKGINYLHQLTKEVDRRNKLEAEAAQRQVEAFSKSLELERQRQSLIAQTAIAQTAPGRNPLSVQYDQAQLKLQEDSAKRLADEVERLGRERQKILSQIGSEQAKKNPDLVQVEQLRASLKDLDDANVTFLAANDSLTAAQQRALEVDFAGRFADQVQAATETVFGVVKALNSDNPFVEIFDAPNVALRAFRDKFGEFASETLQFQKQLDALTQQNLEKARSQQSLNIFGIQQQQARFGELAGITYKRSPDEINRAIFEQFENLQANGREGLKAADKFLTDAANSNQLTISALLPDQAKQVFQAYSDLQAQIVFQEQEAKALADKREAERQAIENARTKAITDAAEATNNNTIAISAMVQVLAQIRDHGLAQIDLMLGDGLALEQAGIAGASVSKGT